MKLFHFAKQQIQRALGMQRGDGSLQELILPSDTMLTSFPRSGNTWFRHLITDTILQSINIPTDTNLPLPIDHLLPSLQLIESQSPAVMPEGWPLSTRLIKTQLAYHPRMKRVILLYRDPTDALCSYYHDQLRYEPLQHMKESGLDKFCLGALPNWLEHVSSYLDASAQHECELLTIAYETLLDSPVEELQRTFDFLNLDISREDCARAVEHHALTFYQHEELASLPASAIEPKAEQPTFLRSGEIGPGKSELTTATYNAIQNQAQPLYWRAMMLCEGSENRRAA
jgi:hypothetical protein